MQHLELKTKTARVNTAVNGNVVEVERQLSYRQLIRDVLGHVPPAGFSLDETSERLRVRNALDGCENSCLALEDADAEKLKECVRNMRWGFLADAFEEFSKDVLAMTENKGD